LSTSGNQSLHAVIDLVRHSSKNSTRSSLACAGTQPSECEMKCTQSSSAGNCLRYSSRLSATGSAMAVAYHAASAAGAASAAAASGDAASGTPASSGTGGKSVCVCSLTVPCGVNSSPGGSMCASVSANAVTSHANPPRNTTTEPVMMPHASCDAP